MIHLIILTLVDTKEKCAFVIENINRIYVYAYRDEYGYRYTENRVDDVSVVESVEEIVKRINQIVYGQKKHHNWDQ